MRAINLIGGGHALVSDDDFVSLSAHSWRAIESKPGYVYACRNEKGTGRRIRMHREICSASPSQVVDHINGNTLDNRRENLRAVSNAENLQNITRPVRSGTGYRNVYSHGAGYIVRAYRNGSRIYGGWHASLSEAIAARDRIAAIVAPTERAWEAVA